MTSCPANALTNRGVQLGDDVLTELQALRDRLAELEEKQARLTTVWVAIDEELQGSMNVVAEAESTCTSLRERKKVCTDINASMPDFLARLESDFYWERLDSLIDEAKVGTGRWQSTLEEVRQELDRARLVEVAVRSAEGRLDLVSQSATLESPTHSLDAARLGDGARSRRLLVGELARET